MRVGYLASLLLLLAIQSAFYFVALLYQPPIIWLVLPLATAAFYFYSARQTRTLRAGILLASAAIGLLVSWPLIFAALSFSARGGFPGLSSLAWGVGYFLIANALNLAGADLVRRASFRS